MGLDHSGKPNHRCGKLFPVPLFHFLPVKSIPKPQHHKGKEHHHRKFPYCRPHINAGQTVHPGAVQQRSGQGRIFIPADLVKRIIGYHRGQQVYGYEKGFPCGLQREPGHTHQCR